MALGQQMYQAGIDDGQLGAQIRDLDERICRATAIQAPSKALKLQREQLILQLADAALAEEGRERTPNTKRRGRPKRRLLKFSQSNRQRSLCGRCYESATEGGSDEQRCHRAAHLS